MTDEFKLNLSVSRAARAKSLLNDELLQEAFAKLDAAYVQAWRDSDPRDNDGRQRVWQAIQVLGKVRAHLTTMVSDGKLAQHEIDDLIARQERAA